MYQERLEHMHSTVMKDKTMRGVMETLALQKKKKLSSQ